MIACLFVHTGGQEISQAHLPEVPFPGDEIDLQDDIFRVIRRRYVVGANYECSGAIVTVRKDGDS